MLKIRLQRIGKRGQAYFRVVVTEHTRAPKGKYLELLGSYDPHKNEVSIDAEKVRHWLGQGAKMSGTVNNLLVGRNVIAGKKVRVWKPKPQKKGTESEAQKNQEVEQASVTSQEAENKEEKNAELTTEALKEGVKEEPKVETPKNENSTTMPEGEFALTIEHIEYRNANVGLNDSDFVSLLNVTLILDNNKLDFVPFVTFDLYDNNHRDYKNSNGESVQLDQIQKGNKRTDIAILKSLSLVDINVEKTLRVRIGNYADDSIIKNEEKTFRP